MAKQKPVHPLDSSGESSTLVDALQAS